MKKWINLIKLIMFSFISGILIISALYLYAYFCPKINVGVDSQIILYDNNGDIVYTGSKTNEYVDLKNISEYLIDAVISTEDKNFYSHNGFDYLRIIKAMYLNIINNKIVQGASTISQQYIKNLFLDFDKTWARKMDEALLTMKLETHYSKEEILEGYLNTINFGQGCYGIESASLFYFNKPADSLSIEEATILAGIPKSPNNYNPITNYDKAIERANYIAKLMKKNNKLSEEDYNKIDYSKIEIYGKRSNNDLVTLMYYQDAVLDELYNLNCSKSLLNVGGIKIYTNLNLEIQKNLENSISKNFLDDNTQVASIVVNPKSGGIMALTGGKNYYKSQYNRAINAKRQVGSTIKPILYYAALENGFTSSSTFLSEPSTFVFANNKTYNPSNYNNNYGHQNITMAAAIAYSDNIYAVKTHLFLGEDTLVNTAKRMGLKAHLEANPSLALGSEEISFIDYVQAYSTLANSGIKKDNHFINKITDLNDNIIYEYENKEEVVLNQNYVYILNELLTSTTNSMFIDYSYPTASNMIGKLSQKYAIKTGSTGTDYLTIGYNPDILCFVWTGLDDNSNVNTKYSNITKTIWADTVESYMKDNGESWYEKPDNIVAKLLNPITGEDNTNNNYLFYYVKGSEYSNTVFKEKE